MVGIFVRIWTINHPRNRTMVWEWIENCYQLFPKNSLPGTVPYNICSKAIRIENIISVVIASIQNIQSLPQLQRSLARSPPQWVVRRWAPPSCFSPRCSRSKPPPPESRELPYSRTPTASTRPLQRSWGCHWRLLRPVMRRSLGSSMC